MLFQSRPQEALPLEIGGITFTGGIRPDLYALGTATTLLSLVVIGGLLVVASLRLRFRGAPVHRVEEELGLAESIEAEAAAGVTARAE